ncbi:MAG: AAA family ATPase, partial [Candidatus Methanomethylophilaceae archaeon]|nr:AAA family ATPase [Candidatus Methanomethylophilaceae archaeon]
MRRALPICVQDFREVREGNYLYVDKTDMIPRILSDGAKVHLCTRPRRFGKSLNLSMLDAFLNLGYPHDNTWFDGLKVSDCRGFDPHRNAHPVIYFDFKDLNATSYEDFLRKLGLNLSRLYRKYGYLADSERLDRADRMDYESIITRTADSAEIEYSLRNLSDMLFKHHGRKVVVLLDEYDSPLHNAYGTTFHGDVLGIMRGMLSSALKGNESLAFGVVTGVMQIAKESIISGLNNLEVNNIFNSDFDEMFGFTDDEVRAICDEYGHPDKYDEAREWYDGYRFGNTDVYNPWSVLKFVKSGFVPRTYWAGTSGNSIIDTLLDNADGKTFDEIGLLARGVPAPKTVDPTVTFADLRGRPDNIYSVMVMSGYLRAEPSGRSHMLSLPNG